MDEQHQKRLRDLLNRQQQRALELAAVKAKTDLRANMPFFDIKYRFAKPEETEKIEAILRQLPFQSPGRPDIAALSGNPVAKPTYQGKAWICFLGGSEAMLHTFIRGHIDDILRDLGEWEEISPFILLLLGDYRHIIFLDDDGSITEAEFQPGKDSADS